MHLNDIIDQENQDEDDATVSSITHVVKVNAHGETIEVQRFSHEHNLVLEDAMKEGNDRPCDGCVLPISTPFYHCSKCNFSLHKNFAELPKTNHHWLQRDIVALLSPVFRVSSLFEWLKLIL